jgi:type IV pilus assembly protein PilV
MSTRLHSIELVGAPSGCRGFTLLEVLIAVLILSIGLLGLAGLQTASLKFNTSAYYLTQATALAYDFTDRMRANRDAALDGDYDIAYADPPPACGVAAAGATIAERDINVWRNALACALPLGNGRVEAGADDTFTITVQWDETRGEVIDGVEPVFGLNAFELTTGL